MPFNISAGLSSMGAAVSQQAGTAALELQKADLEKQKEILADQLATRRETGLETLRQSGEQKLEAGKEVFQSAENTKAQTSAQVIAKMQTGAELGAASIQAAASEANERLAAKAATTQTNYDASTGNLIKTDLLTGQTETLMAPDGVTPLRTMNPAIMPVIRDFTSKADAELKSLSITLAPQLNNAQRDVDASLKSATQRGVADPQKDPAVIDARARQAQAVKEYNEQKKIINDNFMANVQKILPSRSITDAAAQSANRPNAAAFDKTPTIQIPGGGVAPAPALGGDQGGLINTPFGR